jgi:Fungal chitosanase of glycosyl hydrolase group 75
MGMWKTGKLLKTIEGSPVTLGVDGAVRFVGDMDIDSDGGTNVDKDPCWQADTTLKHHGLSINAQVVPYVVCPIGILELVGPIGLGCRCVVAHTVNRREAVAVLADLGPRAKIGEGSPALARKLAINPNSRYGGEDAKVVLYELYIGVPAVIDGVEYALQPLRGA